MDFDETFEDTVHQHHPSNPATPTIPANLSIPGPSNAQGYTALLTPNPTLLKDIQNEGEAIMMELDEHQEEVPVMPQRRVTVTRSKKSMNPKPSQEPASSLSTERSDDTGSATRRSSGRTTNNSLYTAVLAGRTAVNILVNEWIDQYKLEKECAVLSLMQFFIDSSGCKGKITATSFPQDFDYQNLVASMVKEFDMNNLDYPVIRKGQQWIKYRSNFCAFIAQLMNHCQFSIIDYKYLMEKIICLLSVLCISQVRAFRHTATLAVVKLMTALVDVHVMVSSNLENTQQLLETERDEQASATLETKIKELEENLDDIKYMLTHLFEPLFEHRCRDYLPEIRVLCLAELGVWMEKFHTFFLKNPYLEYITRSLKDEVGEVQLTCLQALLPVYASEQQNENLEPFTRSLKDRFVAMTLDKDINVAVHAVRLVMSICKRFDVLTDEDCDIVYELVYSKHRGRAQAVGEFLSAKLFVLDEAFSSNTQRGTQRLRNTPLIKKLVQFFIESQLKGHGPYLVDSLIESNKMVKDFKCMINLLLEEPNPRCNQELLTDRQETGLIVLMVCCVRQVATGELPEGRGPNKRKISAKQLQQIQDDKKDLTELFIRVLPQLLDKYVADPDKLSHLLSLPQYFDLNIYISSQRELDLGKLLDKLKQIVEMHHETKLLEVCSKTLEVLCLEENGSVFTRCDTLRRALFEQIIENFKQAINDWNDMLAEGAQPSTDQTFNMVSSLQKIAIFYSSHDMGQWDIWAAIFKVITDLMQPIERNPVLMSPEFTLLCFRVCYYSLLFDLIRCKQLAQNHDDAEVQGQLENTRDRLHDLMQTLKRLLQLQHSLEYKKEAYLIICDILMAFGYTTESNSNPLVSQLEYEADEELLGVLNSFIQDHVFVYEEEDGLTEESKMKNVNERRTMVASFCKLIIYGVIPGTWAAGVFKHYVKSYDTHGDIIKTSLAKIREVNKITCVSIIVSTLTELYKELLDTNDGHCHELDRVKELARRLGLMFGRDTVKNREIMTELHRIGIEFALSPREGRTVRRADEAPQNLTFLEVLAEFANKLLPQDKKFMLNFLNTKIISPVPSSRSKKEDWQPLELYKNSLLHTDWKARLMRKKTSSHIEEDQQENLDVNNLHPDDNNIPILDDNVEPHQMSVVPRISEDRCNPNAAKRPRVDNAEQGPSVPQRSVARRILDDISEEITLSSLDLS